MPHASELDGTDFRPFFDMVVGILFVLLILIGALIFFQRSDSAATAEAAKAEAAKADAAAKAAEARRARSERDSFLERLAAELRLRGLAARADLAAGAVLLPLDALASVGRTGTLDLKLPAVADLGAVAEAAVGCVSAPRSTAAACAATDALKLQALAVDARLGILPGAVVFPQDRAARFIQAQLSAELFRVAPGLLRASDGSGEPVVVFESSLSTDRTSPERPVPGDLVLGFSFPEAALR